jgi:hypothetical protein
MSRSPTGPPVQQNEMPERCSRARVRWRRAEMARPCALRAVPASMKIATGGFHERAASCQRVFRFFLRPRRIGVCRPTGGATNPRCFFSQKAFCRICCNRRIALLPSALWLLPVPFGVLNSLRVLPSPGSNSPSAHRKRWFSRPCSQSPELGDFTIRNQHQMFRRPQRAAHCFAMAHTPRQ